VPSSNVKLALFAALAASLVAPAALAKPRAARPPPVMQVEAPAPPSVRVAFVPAPRRAEQPELALRPEFSEGEWSQPGRPDELDPAALQEASAPVDSEVGRATTARAGSNLAKIGDRQTQGAQIPTSRLDQPIDRTPSAVITTGGFDFGGLNLKINN
jgi:hypothetical protein